MRKLINSRTVRSKNSALLKPENEIDLWHLKSIHRNHALIAAAHTIAAAQWVVLALN
jgi:stalled ribosome rescue protein Dom34